MNSQANKTVVQTADGSRDGAYLKYFPHRNYRINMDIQNQVNQTSGAHENFPQTQQ